MDKPNQPNIHVFIDADVLYAASATKNISGASLVILRMSEITLIKAISSQQVIVETERNLSKKLPSALSSFHLLARRCLHIVSNPLEDDLQPYQGLADQKDLPILVTAIREKCLCLITFNVRHFQPGHSSVAVMRPGEFLLQIRDRISELSL